MTNFQQLLLKPEYVWDLEEIDRNNWTNPMGNTKGLDQIDTVNNPLLTKCWLSIIKLYLRLGNIFKIMIING